jgi:putative GTP pyrophosphokinase
MSGPEDASRPFDLQTHAQAAISEYLPVRAFYENLANVVARILEQCLSRRGIKVQSVQHRAKEPNSFGRKAAIPSEQDPIRPKYTDPIKQITDLAGVRVIAYFPGALSDIDEVINGEFTVAEKSNKGLELIEEERFGYQSIHYLVRIGPGRTRLAEYAEFTDAIAEVQVRTILQHAWAEIEHDIQYKSSKAIPSEIRRRFMALAGMLEIADKEFQDIQDADMALEEHAKAMVQRGDLGGIEIIPNALKLFLDKQLGPDGRMSDWSYDWTARLLKQLGFRDLQEVEAAIAPYNDDQLSNLAWGGRQGQLTRFELILLAALGDRYIERHPWKDSPWFPSRSREKLKAFVNAGVKVGNYNVKSEIDEPVATAESLGDAAG